MIVFRITGRKFASDIKGIGSATFPGRWNKYGTPVLYTGESKEIALLEALVHFPAGIAPELDLLTIEFPDDSITILDHSNLPSNWSEYPAPAVLAELGEKWVLDSSTIALKVPSSIISTSSNFILNCQHPEYAKVKILDHSAFYFDQRLIKS